MATLPSLQVREALTAKLTDLCTALEDHPKFPKNSRSPQDVPPPLYHVWDFIKRTVYILIELDNIREGKPLQWPDQIPKNESATTNEEKASASMNDVLTRIWTIDGMLTQPMMMKLMTGLDKFDYGDDVLAKSKAVVEATNALK